MEFRNLKEQYQVLKDEIDEKVITVMNNCNFISGKEVSDLEGMLADFVGVKHCITCANGTDALSLAMMTWGIGKGDAVFIPDFTFFSTGEIVAAVGATPIFVDVEETSFNLNPDKLEYAIKKIKREGILNPKVIIAVDLFGLPAKFPEIKEIANKYNMLVLEDGAQGFGGSIDDKRACSFGNISTTSFFPAKPLGCYGDGGAVFTDNDDYAELLKSYSIHWKGENKYDNVRIGLNSRLDTIQAAVLMVKLKAFSDYELKKVNEVAEFYNQELNNQINKPIVPSKYYSSWAQYTLILNSEDERNGLKKHLAEKGIPSMIYYPKGMHEQSAFKEFKDFNLEYPITEKLTRCVLSLPMHPYMTRIEQEEIVNTVNKFYEE